jgi:hypothetical protein
MPGPVGTYRMAGGRMCEVFPIIPLARRAPIAVGALSWDDTVFFAISVGPDLVPSTAALSAATRAIVAELSGERDAGPSETAAANRARG